MLDLSEDEVALLNNEDDLITSASLVSMDDLRQQRKHQKVHIYTESDKFMLMLKRYTNIVYVIVFQACPLFKVLRGVIFELRDLSR